jgi:hypothetical protein
MKKIASFLAVLFFIAACSTSGRQTEQHNDNPETIQAMVKDALSYYADTADVEIFKKIINHAHENKLATKSLSEIELEVARQFIGVPYVGQTLEKDSVESLIVNLRELDCVTFMENVLAISLCIKSEKTSFNDFCETLIKLRYRDGEIDGYLSRLHYTTDWLTNNQKKGIIRIVSQDFGPADSPSEINFMSENPKNYKQLANPAYLEKIKEHEARLSHAGLKYIPKNKVDELAGNIRDGDIIAMSTSIAGLDFSHVAIAAWKNNKLYFIHAAYKEKKVLFSDKTLHDYLSGIKTNKGIVVARLNDI